MTFSRRQGERYNRGRIAMGAVGPAPAPSTPLTIIQSTTVSFWVRADLGIALSSGNSVAGWTDQTGNGRSWSQAGATALQPVLNTGGPGGMPYLTLDGVQTYMQNPFNTTFGFLWVVLRRGDTAGPRQIIAGLAAAQYCLRPLSGTVCTMANTSSVNNTTMNAATWYRTFANFTNSTADTLKVGSTATTGANAGSSGTGGSGMWLGTSGALSAFWKGDIIEIFHCPTSPTGFELAALDAYVTAYSGGGVQV